MKFTVKTITYGFPHPMLAHITGKPNRNNLMKLHKNLCENASSIHSILGGGNHALLAIGIGGKDYLKQTCHSFVAPINLGNYPNIPSHITE